MRWVEEWGEERRIASSSKSPLGVFARSTLDAGEVNWRQIGQELNIEDQKEKEIRKEEKGDMNEDKKI